MTRGTKFETIIIQNWKVVIHLGIVMVVSNQEETSAASYVMPSSLNL